MSDEVVDAADEAEAQVTPEDAGLAGTAVSDPGPLVVGSIEADGGEDAADDDGEDAVADDGAQEEGAEQAADDADGADLEPPARVATGEDTGLVQAEGNLLNRVMARVGATIDERPGTVVLTIMLLSVLLLYPAGQTIANTNTDASDAFLPDDPMVEVSNELSKHFDSAPPMLLILEAEDGNMISRESVNHSEAFLNEIRDLAPIQGKLHSAAPGGGIITASTLINLTLQNAFGTDLQSANDSTFEQARALTFSAENPQGLGMLSKDFDPAAAEPTARYTMVLITLDPEQFRPEDLNSGGNAEVNAIEDAVHQRVHKESTEGLDTFGLVGWTEEFEGGAIQGLGLIWISIVVVLSILYVALRSVKDLFLALLSIPFIFIWMAGLAWVFGVTVNTLSYFAPLLVLALGVDYAIVLLTRQREGRDAGLSESRTIRDTMTHAGAAVTLSMLTTFIAFMSNVTSSIGGLRSFGAFLALGILSAYVAMGIMLPALHHWASKRWGDANGNGTGAPPTAIIAGSEHDATRIHPAELNFYARGAAQAHTRPWAVVAAVVLITGASTYGFLQLEESFSVQDFLSDDAPLLHAFELLDKQFAGSGGGQTLDILIEGEVDSPAFLNATREYLIVMRDAELVGTVDASDPALQLSANSIYHHVVAYTSDQDRADNLSANVTLDQWGVPTTTEGVREVYGILTSQGYMTQRGPVTPNDIRQVLEFSNTSTDYEWALISIEYSGEGSIQRPLQEFGTEQLAVFDEAPVEPGLTGANLIFLALSDAIVETMQWSIVLTISMCLLVLMFTLRSITLGLLTTIPVLFVTIALFGFMNVTGMTLNLLTVLIAAISIGVGVDFSIHVTHRFLEGRDDGLPVSRAINIAMGTTGRALTAAAVSSTLGFLVLLFADLNMFQTFGQLAAAMTAFSLMAAVFVLPTMLKWWATMFDTDRDLPEGLDEASIPSRA